MPSHRWGSRVGPVARFGVRRWGAKISPPATGGAPPSLRRRVETTTAPISLPNRPALRNGNCAPRAWCGALSSLAPAINLLSWAVQGRGAPCCCQCKGPAGDRVMLCVCGLTRCVLATECCKSGSPSPANPRPCRSRPVAVRS